MSDLKLIFLLLSVIEMTQCISIGVFLIIINRKQKTSYLGIFLLVLGITNIPEILGKVNSTIAYEYIDNSFVSFYFLLATIFYNYIDSLHIQPNKVIRNRITLFGLLMFTLGISILFLPKPIQIKLYKHWAFVYFELSSILFFAFIFIYSIFQIKSHNKKIREQYSNTRKRELNWVLHLILFLIVSVILLIFSEYSLKSSDYIIEISYYICSLIWIYGMAYNGLFFQISKNLIQHQYEEKPKSVPISINLPIQLKSEIKEVKSTPRYNNSIIEKIEKKVRSKKLFLNNELTIVDLSLEVGIHPKVVSQTINNIASQNFNTYINNFRLKYAQEILKDPEYKNLTIESISEMSGFKSNSAFYSAFKKTLSMTPNQYQKQYS